MKISFDRYDNKISIKEAECIYNPPRRLNVSCMESNKTRVRFITSSFQTPMSYSPPINNHSIFFKQQFPTCNPNTWYTDIKYMCF